MQARSLPAATLTDVRTGQKVSFANACPRGRVTLVCFWGTWCAHGKRQEQTIARNLPTWQRLMDFHHIAIATDQEGLEHQLLPYIQARGWTFPCYTDPGSALKHALGASALPYIVIVDKKGRIAYTHTGYLTDVAILRKLREMASR
ncbi:hypothetical protein GCM10023093_31810 [Nemorincola caseinilytica]|uniref:Thioredoxin domain-containing protein n=1 Tax=Nemorincola caseinilytica TaxID=2054315 RepID=A0ABP8NT77_9BACT